MQFALTDDQRAIKDSVEGFLAQEADLDRLRTVIADPSGWDEALWTAMAGEMGYCGLMVPEAYDGIGVGAVEMALVLEQTGARLAVIPFFETAVLAVQAILNAGTQAQKQELLPTLAAGGTKATLAFAGPDGRAAPEGIAARLTRDGDGWRLDGAAGFVPFAHVADLLIVAARTEGADGLSLIALPADTAGLSITRQPPLDLTRPFSRLDFDHVAVMEAQILGAPGTADAALERTLTIGAGLIAAEQTGGAAFCLSSTVDYALQRVQFGRAIGAFQAVKHTLADMMVQVEAARSAALYAAAAIDGGSEELFEAASAAKSWCSEAYRACAGEAIQLHGGIGFTWEHHAHLYFKRAWASGSWLGEPSEHRERIAGRIGLGPL